MDLATSNIGLLSTDTERAVGKAGLGVEVCFYHVYFEMSLSHREEMCKRFGYNSLEFMEVWAGDKNLTVIKVQKWYKVLTFDGVNLDRDVKNNQKLSLDLLQCSEDGRQ